MNKTVILVIIENVLWDSLNWISTDLTGNQLIQSFANCAGSKNLIVNKMDNYDNTRNKNSLSSHKGKDEKKSAEASCSLSICDLITWRAKHIPKMNRS